MNEWISVKDREPDKAGCILVYDGHCHVAEFRPEQKKGFYRYDCDTYDVEPSHWMPLPTAPKD